MKKILSVLLIITSLFCLTSCKEKITDDASALEAYLDATAKQMKANGSAMEGSVELFMVVEGAPVNVSGTFSGEGIVSPDFGTKVDLNLKVGTMGMAIPFPVEMYIVVEDGEMLMYMNIFGTWGCEVIPVGYDYQESLKEMLSEEYIDSYTTMIRNCISAKYNGVTKVNDVSVYDIDIVFNSNLGTELVKFLIDSGMEEEFGELPSSAELAEIGKVFEGISYKAYLNKKDCSLFGVSIVLDEMMEKFVDNLKYTLGEDLGGEIPEIKGSMDIYYLDKKVKGITIPEEAEENAVSIENMFMM